MPWLWPKPTGGWAHETPAGGGDAGNAAVSRFIGLRVSSQLRHECPGFDEIISTGDDDFATSGLKVSSLIRLGLIATIPRTAVLGELGAISTVRLQGLRLRLAAHIRSEPR